MATNATIPSIPLSPITKAWLLCQDNLEQADEALKTAKKQTHPEVSLNVLRRLIEDVKIQRDRYENLGRQMQSLQTETCFHWSPDTLAKQIAIVDCQLFGLVKLDNTSLLCQLDMKQTHLDKLMDFHSYLTNSFAHQLIFWSDQIYSPQHHQQQPKESMISHLVQVAYALFHTYRDLSGFAAIMKALMLPEVRRLRSIWKRCSSRTKEMYTEMVVIMSPDHHYQAYHQALYKKLASFFFNNSDQPHYHSITASTNQSSSSKMVIIPWIQPHLLSIHSIVTDYAAVGGGHATSQVPAATGLCHQQQQDMELVLSAPGLQKLAIVVALLEQCQTCTTTSSSSSTIDLLEDILKPFRQDINNSSTSSSASKNDYDQINNNSNNNNNNNKKKNRRQSVLSMPPKLSFDINHNTTTSSFHSQQTIHYLNQLYPGDLSVHHWLVSRVYLRKDQLVEESLQVQPLLHGEQLVCDAYSPDDEALMMITNTKHLELLQHHLSQSNKKKLQDQVEEEERKEELSPRISATFAGWKSTALDESFSSSISQELHNHSDQQIDKKKEKEEEEEEEDNDDDDDDDHKSEGDMGNNNDAKIVKSQELDDINIFQNNNKPPAIIAANDILSTRKEQDTATLDDLVKLSTSITTLNQTTTDQKVEVKEKDKKEMIQSEQQQIENKENNISKNNVIKNTNNNNTIITKTTTTSNIDQSFTNTNDSSKNIDNNINHINNKNNNHNDNNNNNISEKEEKEKKSKLSPTAPEFVPSYHYTSSIQSNNKKSATDNNNNNNNVDDDDSSEEWNGYPTPTLEQQQQNPSNHSDEDEEEDDEVWTGYPGSKRPASIQSMISEEWKGYQAAKMEATWEMETALKVQLHEWQGYALETLNEEDLDGQ